MDSINNLTQNHIPGYDQDKYKKITLGRASHCLGENKMSKDKLYKKPITSGSTIRAVNGKYGIPSKSLILSMKYFKLSESVETTQGSGMDRPKSDWSCSQNSPPEVFQLICGYIKGLKPAFILGEKNANEYQSHPGRQRNEPSRVSKINGYHQSNYLALGAWRAWYYFRNFRQALIRITDYDCPNSRSNWVNFINEQSV